MTLICRYLDTVGDGTGTKNATGDYTIATGTPTDFFIAPAVGTRYLIRQLAIVVADNANFTSTTYGGGTALATGYAIEHQTDDATVLTDFTNGVPVRTNGSLIHFGELSLPASTDWDAGASQTLRAVLDFGAWSGDNSGLILNGTSNERLTIPFTNDDCSALTGHYFIVQGRTI